ncbi:MAG: hypothetical protein ACPLRW_04730 [Moorellales bacterium]
MRIAASLLAGTLILAAALVLQVRTVPPEPWAVFQYNVLILPAMLLANVLLGYGFVSASRAGWSLPAVSAGQIFAYQVSVFVLSRVLLRQELPKPLLAAAAFLLMALGVGMLAGPSGR